VKPFPDLSRDHLLGSPEGPLFLLEYGDYECPFCGEAQAVVSAVRERLGKKLCFAFRHFPLTRVHPHALHAAEAAEAAAAQGNFWAMHELLFANQQALADEDLFDYAVAAGLNAKRLLAEVVSGAHVARVQEDFKSGVRGGVNGTPAFFINGVRYDGDRGVEAMVSALTE
jgi:protein-disulfide isomerase